MKGEEQELRKAADKVGVQISDDLVKHVSTLLEKTVQTGAIPKEAFGFTDERMEAVYAQAYRLYNTGNYRDAIKLFRILVLLGSTEPKYYLGMAACFHMLKEYDNAIKAYTITAVIDGTSPIPYFHAADCYIQMRDQASAMIVLNLAAVRAGERPEYQILKDRALLMIDSLKKELAQTEEAKK